MEGSHPLPPSATMEDSTMGESSSPPQEELTRTSSGASSVSNKKWRRSSKWGAGGDTQAFVRRVNEIRRTTGADSDIELLPARIDRGIDSLEPLTREEEEDHLVASGEEDRSLRAGEEATSTAFSPAGLFVLEDFDQPLNQPDGATVAPEPVPIGNRYYFAYVVSLFAAAQAWRMKSGE